ncbi:MAG: N-acyl-D-amino-acid deacylase family protein [Phreatobacter sp.]
MSSADFIIRNALIIDGTGAPGRVGDVAVAGDRIVAVGEMLPHGGPDIDVKGLALAPGFIDAHTHDDRAVIADPAMTCKVSQGVTTVVVGNCGISLSPVVAPARPPAPIDLIGSEPEHFFATFSGYFEHLRGHAPALNVVAQAGHSSLRFMAMDDLKRPATEAEIGRMQGMLRQALGEGAAGFSTGLEYPTAEAAPTEEIERIAEVVHEFGGFHSTHMRNEGADVMASLAESARIGKHAQVPVVISHHKLSGVDHHGKSVETLAAIEGYRASQVVSLDVYPYVASSTMLAAVRVKRSTRTMIAWSVPFPELSGRDLADVMREMNLTLDEAVERLSPAGAIYFQMDEADVSRILAYPHSMIGSDGLPHDNHPHPRLWGTFPRVLGHYVRETGVLTLEDAVRKMTGHTAATFGLRDRGVIGEGAFADLVLFDPATVIDTASFEKPAQPAAGISGVWVNGVLTWNNGGHSGARAGRGLARDGLQRLAWAA